MGKLSCIHDDGISRKYLAYFRSLWHTWVGGLKAEETKLQCVSKGVTYFLHEAIHRYNVLCICAYLHNVESPSMVDPQWNIWYWGSKWNFHTVCWGSVGCEWGTTSVYFGITYVCFSPSRLPVVAVESQYRHQDFFIFVKSIIWRTHTKSSKKIMLV